MTEAWISYKSHREPHRQFPELASFSVNGGSGRKSSIDFLFPARAPPSRPGKPGYKGQARVMGSWDGCVTRGMSGDHVLRELWPPAGVVAQLGKGTSGVLISFLLL